MAADIDRDFGALATSGRAVSTRRNYLRVSKGLTQHVSNHAA
jgi:hypothetical protein